MQTTKMILAVAVMLLAAGTAMADTFGTGANQFTMDFVTISGATNPTSGYGVVNYDYRMGTFDVTNAQFSKFMASLGVPVSGTAYWGSYTFGGSYFTGANVPVNKVNWYEAAQFVNWLNTSSGYARAYNFTGNQGTPSYTLATWSPSQAANGGANLYRNKDAKYFLPNEDEWVKAAYWNSATLQLQAYATKDNSTPTQGNGTNGTGWNFYNNGYATNPAGPWAVGSGSQELNGTYDMMGNVWQWMESPYYGGDYNDGTYGTGSFRGLRGGSYGNSGTILASSCRNYDSPVSDYHYIGFRVASEVPEPTSFVLLVMGGLALVKRRRN